MLHCTTLKSNYDFILFNRDKCNLYLYLQPNTLLWTERLCPLSPYVESYPQCDGVRSWGSLGGNDVMRVGHSGMRLVPLEMRPKTDGLSLSPPCAASARSLPVNQRASAETQYACTLTLDFLAPKTLKNKCLLFNLSHLWCQSL